MTAPDFWSRRKAAVEAEDRAERAAEAARQQAAEEARLADRSDEALLAEAGLPEPETLDSADQVQEFLRSALPQRLKARALRRLWRLNPVLANLDGLVDYGGDYTDAATVVENLQTAYQVGKGMLARLEDLAEAPDAEAAVAPDAAAATDPVPEAAAEPEPEPGDGPETVLAAAPAEPAVAPPADPPAAPAVAPRRMRFRFDQTT